MGGVNKKMPKNSPIIFILYEQGLGETILYCKSMINKNAWTLAILSFILSHFVKKKDFVPK